MYKIVICDDDKNFISELKQIIKECNKKERELTLIEFSKGKDLLERLPFDSDVLFLNIQLEDADGNEIAIRLKEIGYRGLLVQCSGVYMPTPETVKISPYRYLLKQAGREAMKKEIIEIFQEMDWRRACFTLTASYQREKVIVRTMDIVFFTHHKKGSVLHLNKQRAKQYTRAPLITPYNFKSLLEMLGAIGFVCPHNSYIVNLHYVSAFNPTKEFLELDGQMMSVSRSKITQFTKEFTDFVNRKYKERMR